jgi:hypothetical protein
MSVGANVPQAGGCVGFNFDNDTDVDLDDFSILQGCLSGPTYPATPPAMSGERRPRVYQPLIPQADSTTERLVDGMSGQRVDGVPLSSFERGAIRVPIRPAGIIHVMRSRLQPRAAGFAVQQGEYGSNHNP